MDALEQPRTAFHEELRSRFSTLSRISNWANAHDVETLAQAIFRSAVKSIANDSLVMDEDTILGEVDRMITERMQREVSSFANPSIGSGNYDLPLETQSPHPNAHATKSTANTNLHDQAPEKGADQTDCTPQPAEARQPRDPGVTDAVWGQLQKDKAAEDAREQEYQELLKEEDAAKKMADDAQGKEKSATTQGTSAEQGHDDEARNRHEQKRLKHELERRAQEERPRQLQKKREEEQKRRTQEQEAQKKLRQMGVCPVGFRWIKQASGYRCAGRAHFVSNEQIEM